MTEKFEEFENRLTMIESRVDKVESRVDDLETNEKATSFKIEALLGLYQAYMETTKGLKKGQDEIKTSVDFIVQHILRQGAES